MMDQYRVLDSNKDGSNETNNASTPLSVVDSHKSDCGTQTSSIPLDDAYEQKENSIHNNQISLRMMDQYHILDNNKEGNYETDNANAPLPIPLDDTSEQKEDKVM